MPRGIPKNKPGQGRPTRKTEVVVNILISCISKGLHVKTACGLAKITEASFYKWISEDKDFQSQINYARGAAILRLHSKVEDQDPKFILKNLEPKLYRDRIETELSGNDNQPIKLIVEDLRVDENGLEEVVVKTEKPKKEEPPII